MMRKLLHSRTSARPRSVSPSPVSPVEGERDAVAEDGRAAPHRAERTQAHGVEEVQRVEVGADGLGPFEMEDPGDSACGHRGADVSCSAAPAEAALRGAFHPQKMAQHPGGDWPGDGVRDQVGQGDVVGRVIHRVMESVEVHRLGRGDVDGEEAAREARSQHARQVEVPSPFAVQPEAVAGVPGGVDLEDDVVVAVKDGNLRGHGCSGVEVSGAVFRFCQAGASRADWSQKGCAARG
jgi:hypothetical protein